MPYLPDGSFVADMPSPPAGGDVLAQPGAGTQGYAPINKHTGLPYKIGGQSNVLAKPPSGAPKPGYAHTNVPMFPEYAKFAASRDGVDLHSADDKQLLAYAKEYSEHMLPQALMAAGHKVDKEYLKTLTPNFQYETAQNLPKLREYFKANIPAMVVPPEKEGGALQTAKDVGKDVLAGIPEGLGNALAAIPRFLQAEPKAPEAPPQEAPQDVMDSIMQNVKGANALAGKVASLATPTGLTSAVKNELANRIPNYNETFGKVATLLSSSGKAAAEHIKESQSAAYKADQKEPFVSGEPFVKDGKINPGYFNAKAFNIANLIGKPAEAVGEIAPALAATYAAKSPLPIMASMGLSGAGNAWQEEENRLNALPEEQLKELPTYKALIKQGYTPEGAKQSLIYHSSAVQGELAGAAGVLTGVLAELPWLQKSAGGFLTKVGKNVLKQAPAFSALGAGQTAASNVLRKEATGENVAPSEGVANAAIAGAAGALPFAVAGGAAPHPEAAPVKAAEAVRSSEPVSVGGTPTGGVDAAVKSSVAQAFEEHPVPKAEVLADPVQAQAHYDEAKAAFRGTLAAEDLAPDQIAGAMPAFDAAWREQTGLDPAALSAVKPAEGAAPAAEEPVAGTPEALDAAAAAAPPEEAPRTAAEELGLTPEPASGADAREAGAAATVPQGVHDRVQADLTESLGREPTPVEVATAAQQFFDIALSDPRIDGNIPREALEEAIGQLAAKSKEIPSAKAINELANKLAAEPKPVSLLSRRVEDVTEPYGRAPDALMGFKREGPQTAYEDSNYRHNEYLRVTLPSGDTFIDGMDGLNKSHALERARRNWEGAKIEAVSRDTALAEDPQATRHMDQMLEVKKGNQAKKRDVLAKKTEAASQEAEQPLRRQDDAATTAEGKPRLASEEERAAYKPVEEFYRRYNNVEAASRQMAGRLREGPLKTTLNRILANPYLVERLKSEPLHIHNPGDKLLKASQEGIGSFLRKSGDKTMMESNWGVYHPKDGVTLAGSGWAPRNATDNGLHPVTFVHEALHAAISHVVRGVESGAIKDANLVAAHTELENFAKTLKEKAEGLTTDKDTLGSLKYAGTNVHELLSVAFTDSRAQSVLQRLKMGTVNAWQRLMGIFSRMLGGSVPEDTAALSRVVELGNRFIDYKPEGFTEKGEEAPLYSRRSERVEENTAPRVMDAIRVKSSAEQAKEAADIAREQNQPTKAQAIQISLFDKLKSLTFKNEQHVREGRPVTPKEDMDTAARVYQNLASRNSNLAQQQYIEPALKTLTALATKFKKPADELFTQLSAYYFGQRAKEVNLRGELESARLKKEAEAKRQEIKDAWAEGKLTDGKYLEELKSVVNAPGARVANRTPLYKAGITDEVAQELIARAKKWGITPEVVAEFEPHRKAMVDSINKNYRESGRFSAADDARRTGLGSKWYLPLKGFGEAGDAAAFEGSGIGAFTREYTGAKGRGSIAANPLMNLMQETLRAARDPAESAFTKTVYNYAKKYGKDEGIKLRTYDYEKAVKDAISSGGSIADVERVFKNENAVVHNNGEFKYSIEFPEDSAVLKAIKSINESPELNAFQRTVGKVTNLIARGATTLNPKFLLWNAFWRDTGYVGTQIGMDLGPQAMAQYAARYWLQGGPLRGRRTYFKSLTKTRNALERDQYAAEGKSKFAKSLAELAQYGGDLSFENELNNVRSMSALEEALKNATATGAKATLKQGAHEVVKFLDQIGTSDIMTARVAAYETYVDVATKKLGHAPTPAESVQIKKDGAMFSRRVLDYQQRSDLSRSLSIAYPFLRVVMNQTDRLLTTFKKPDGSYDLKKAAAMTAVGMMAGATYYSLLRQANPDVQKQENSTLAQNFVVPVGDDLVRIPMAYGLTRLMLVPGMMMARAAYGDTSNEDAVNEIRNAIAEGFTPFKPPEAHHNATFHDEVMDLMTAVTPGPVRPFVELERNKNMFGSSITPNEAFVKGEHSEAGFRGTPDIWKWAAKTLNEFSGGTVDVFPESLEYLTNAYGTGPANAFMRLAAMSDRSSKGAETNAQQLPFIPNVISNDAKYYETRKLHEIEDDLVHKGEKTSDEEKAALRSIRSSRTRFGKERKAVDKNSLLSAAAKNKAMEDISKRQDAEQKQLLKEVGKYGD